MINNILNNVDKLLSTLGGWVVAVVVTLLNFIGDVQMAFAAVFLAIFTDMMWGVIAAVKQKRFILSQLLRETFSKVAIYSSALFLIMVIERSINEDWFFTTKTACAIAAACELWSIFANILIVKPDTPFICVFRKYLAGEINRKLNLDAESMLNKDDKNDTKGV